MLITTPLPWTTDQALVGSDGKDYVATSGSSYKPAQPPEEPPTPIVQESFCPGEVVPDRAIGSVQVCMLDGTLQMLSAGDDITDQVDGYLIIDEVTNKPKFVQGPQKPQEIPDPYQPIQETFCAGETLPDRMIGLVNGCLTDGTLLPLAAGMLLPLDLDGCINIDEVSNRAGFQQNAVKIPDPVDVFFAYVEYDPALHFPGTIVGIGSALDPYQVPLPPGVVKELFCAGETLPARTIGTIMIDVAGTMMPIVAGQQIPAGVKGCIFVDEFDGLADCIPNKQVAVILQTEIFGPGSTLPLDMLGTVEICLDDETTLQLSPGDQIPANALGKVIVDEISNEAAWTQSPVKPTGIKEYTFVDQNNNSYVDPLDPTGCKIIICKETACITIPAEAFEDEDGNALPVSNALALVWILANGNRVVSQHYQYEDGDRRWVWLGDGCCIKEPEPIVLTKMCAIANESVPVILTNLVQSVPAPSANAEGNTEPTVVTVDAVVGGNVIGTISHIITNHEDWFVFGNVAGNPFIQGGARLWVSIRHPVNVDGTILPTLDLWDWEYRVEANLTVEPFNGCIARLAGTEMQVGNLSANSCITTSDSVVIVEDDPTSPPVIESPAGTYCGQFVNNFNESTGNFNAYYYDYDLVANDASGTISQGRGDAHNTKIGPFVYYEPACLYVDTEGNVVSGETAAGPIDSADFGNYTITGVAS